MGSEQGHATFHFEYLCTVGGIDIKCADGFLRAVDEDGARVMELPLDGELIGALRRIEVRTLSTDARRVELAAQAMSAVGASG